jgi:hypothetical protein
MLIGLVGLALVLAGLLRAAPAAERATVSEIISARMIAAARLRQFAEEREERFRYYHRAWTTSAGRRAPGRYVLPFTNEGRR